MILTRVKVRSIRSYESGVVEIPEGIVVLSGEIGSGKSSLLYAIETALFGFAEADPSNLLRHGTSSGEVEAEFDIDGLSVVFSRTLTRSVSGGKEGAPKQKCYITRGGRRTEVSTSEMKREASKMLGFPDDPNPRRQSDLWKWAVYVRQEKMREILDKSEDRLESIRRAHGLEEYRIAGDNAGELVKELRDRARILRVRGSDLASQASGLKESRERLKGLVDASPPMRSEFEELTKKLDALRAELEQKRKVTHELALCNERISKAMGREESSRNIIVEKKKQVAELTAGLRATLANAKLKEEALVQTAVTETDVAAKKDEYLKAKSRANEAEGTASRFRDEKVRLKHLEEEVVELERRLERSEASLAGKMRERSELDRRISNEKPLAPSCGSADEIRKGLEDVQRLLLEANSSETVQRREAENLKMLIESGECPTCHQRVSGASFEIHLKEVETARAEAKTKLGQFAQRKLELESGREAWSLYEKMILTWEHLAKTSAKLSDAISAESAEIESEKEKKRLRTEALSKLTESIETEGDPIKLYSEQRAEEDRSLASFDAVRAAFDHKKEVENQHSNLLLEAKHKESELARLSTEIASVTSDLDAARREYEGLKSELAVLQAEIEKHVGIDDAERTTESALNAKRDQLTRTGRDIENLGKDVLRMEEALRKSEESALKAVNIGLLLEWLCIFTDSLGTIEKQRLERIRADFLDRFSNYYALLVEDEGMRAAMDAAFKPSVEIAGTLTPPEALSGGERTALALAYRLALGHTVRTAHRLKLDTLILDEPTEGFSAEQVTRLSELLRELGQRQILIVTHEENLAGVADQVIGIEKVDGRSVISSTAARSAPSTTPSMLTIEARQAVK